MVLHGIAHAGINQQWGLSNELFVLGDSLVLTVLGQVSFMPVLVLAARLCPEVPHHLAAPCTRFIRVLHYIMTCCRCSLDPCIAGSGCLISFMR